MTCSRSWPLGEYDASRFGRVPQGAGYARWHVDLALEDLHRRAALGPVARFIEGVRFKPRRLSGYDMGSVDQLLDEIQASAERGESLTSLVIGRRISSTFLRAGYDKVEVDAFLDELIARAGG